MEQGSVSHASSTGSSTIGRAGMSTQQFESSLLPLIHSFSTRYPPVVSVISVVVEVMQYLAFALNPRFVGSRLVWGIIYLFQLPFWDGVFTKDYVSYTNFIILYWVLNAFVIVILVVFALGLHWTFKVTQVVRTLRLPHLLSLLLSILYIPTLQALLSAFMCQHAARRTSYSNAANGFVLLFAEKSCDATIVKVHMGCSIALLIVWGTLSYLFTMTLIPFDREDGSVRRRCNTTVDFYLFIYRVGLSVSSFFMTAYGKHRDEAVIVSVMSFLLAFLHCLYLPYYRAWMNSFWAVAFAVVGWAALTIVIVDSSTQSSLVLRTVLTQQGGLYAILCCGAVLVGGLFYYFSRLRYDRTTMHLFSRVLKREFVSVTENPFAVAALQRNLDLLPFPRNLPETDAFFSSLHYVATGILEEGLREEEAMRRAQEADMAAARGAGETEAKSNLDEADPKASRASSGHHHDHHHHHHSRSSAGTDTDSSQGVEEGDEDACSDPFSANSLLREAHRRQVVSPTIRYALLPSDAEVSVRFLSEWQAKTETFPTPHMVCFSSRIFHRFLLKYPRNGMLVIAYISFLCDYVPGLPQMTLCLELMRRCCAEIPLSLTERYLIYYFSLHVKESLGIRDVMHQAFARTIRRMHQDALLKNALVWRCLLEEQRSPLALYRFTSAMARARWRCYQVYMSSVATIAEDAALMRSLGEFMGYAYHFKSASKLCSGVAEVIARLQQLRLEKTYQTLTANVADDAAHLASRTNGLKDEGTANGNEGNKKGRRGSHRSTSDDDDNEQENAGSASGSEFEDMASSGAGSSSHFSSSLGSSTSRLSSLCTSEGRSSQSKIRNSKKMSRQMSDRVYDSIRSAYVELTAHMRWGALIVSDFVSIVFVFAAILVVSCVVMIQLEKWNELQHTMEEISHSHSFCFAVLTQTMQAARLLPTDASVGLTLTEQANLESNITYIRALINTAQAAHSGIFYGEHRVKYSSFHDSLTHLSQFFEVYTNLQDYQPVRVSFLTHIPMVLAAARRAADSLAEVPTQAEFFASTDLTALSSNVMNTLTPSFTQVEGAIVAATKATSDKTIILCVVFVAVALALMAVAGFLILFNFRRAASIIANELMHFYLIPRESVEQMAAESQRQLEAFTVMMSLTSNRAMGANKAGVAELEEAVDDPGLTVSAVMPNALHQGSDSTGPIPGGLSTNLTDGALPSEMRAEGTGGDAEEAKEVMTALPFPSAPPKTAELPSGDLKPSTRLSLSAAGGGKRTSVNDAGQATAASASHGDRHGSVVHGRPASVRLLSHLLTRVKFDAGHGTAGGDGGAAGGAASLAHPNGSFSAGPSTARSAEAVGLPAIVDPSAERGNDASGSFPGPADEEEEEAGEDTSSTSPSRSSDGSQDDGRLHSGPRKDDGDATGSSATASESSPSNTTSGSTSNSEDLKLLNVFDYHDVVSNDGFDGVFEDSLLNRSTSSNSSNDTLQDNAYGNGHDGKRGGGDGGGAVADGTLVTGSRSHPGESTKKERRRLKKANREAKMKRIAEARKKAENIGFMAANYELAVKIIRGSHGTGGTSTTRGSTSFTSTVATTATAELIRLRRLGPSMVLAVLFTILGFVFLVSGLFRSNEVSSFVGSSMERFVCLNSIGNVTVLSHLHASRYVVGAEFGDYFKASEAVVRMKKTIQRCRSDLNSTVFFAEQESLASMQLIGLALVARNAIESAGASLSANQAFPLVADLTWEPAAQSSAAADMIYPFLTPEELVTSAPYTDSDTDYALPPADRQALAIATLLGPYGLAVMEGVSSQYAQLSSDISGLVLKELQRKHRRYVIMQVASIVCWGIAFVGGLLHLYLVLFPPSSSTDDESSAGGPGGSAPGSGSGALAGAADGAQMGGGAQTGGAVNGRSQSADLFIIAMLLVFLTCTLVGIVVAALAAVEVNSLIVAYRDWIGDSKEMVTAQWSWHKVLTYSLAYPFVNYEKCISKIMNATSPAFFQMSDSVLLPQPNVANPSVHTVEYFKMSQAKSLYRHYSWLAMVCAIWGREQTSIFSQYPDIRYVRWDMVNSKEDETFKQYQRLYPLDTYLSTFDDDVTAFAAAGTPEDTLKIAQGFITSNMLKDLAQHSVDTQNQLLVKLFEKATTTIDEFRAKAVNTHWVQLAFFAVAFVSLLTLIVALAVFVIQAFSQTVEERIVFQAAFAKRSSRVLSCLGFIFLIIFIDSVICIVFSVRNVELTHVALQVLRNRHNPNVLMATATGMAAATQYQDLESSKTALTELLDELPGIYREAYYSSRAAVRMRAHRSTFLYGTEEPFADFTSSSSLLRTMVCTDPTNAESDGNQQPYRIQLDVYYDTLRALTTLPTATTLQHGSLYPYLDDAASRLGTIQYLTYADTSTALSFMRSEQKGYFAASILLLVLALISAVLLYLLCLRRIEVDVRQQSVGSKIMLLGIPPDILNTLPEITEFYDPEAGSSSDQMKKRIQQSERLLQNILPLSISRRLKNGERVIADSHSRVTVVFAALVGVDEYSYKLCGTQLVQFMNGLVVAFDHVVDLLDLEKIKLVGDIYFFCGGLTRKTERDHAIRCVEASLFFFQALEDHNSRHGTPNIKLKIGINTGPVVAGVIGNKKVAYDLWGDCVNTASRMYSTGQPGRIQISESTFERVSKYYQFEDNHVQAKGKGELLTHLYVDRLRPTAYSDLNWRLSN